MSMLLLGAVLSLLLSQSPVVPAAPRNPVNSPANKATANIHEQIDNWIRGSEQQDIPWKVHVQRPILTFQQRHVVRVTADIDPAALQKQTMHRNLLFVIKVADESGRWLPGENYVEQEFTAHLDKGTEVEMESEVLLRPGKYRIATVMYDSVLHQHNVGFSSIVVDEPKKDPLPHMLDSVQQVEFLHGNDLIGTNTFSDSKVNLPLITDRPIQLDLLVDLSTREPTHKDILRPSDIFRQPRSASKKPADKSYADGLIQSASVLSDITPSAGCVRISAFDAIKQTVEMEPTAGESMDWDALRERVLGPDRETISINALAGRKDVPRFIVRQLEKLASPPPCAQANSAKPLHVVVLLSHGLSFPEGSQKVKAENCDCTVFYMRQSDVFVGGDDLKQMLSALPIRILGFNDPDQFRRRLSDLLNDLQAIAK